MFKVKKKSLQFSVLKKKKVKRFLSSVWDVKSTEPVELIHFSVALSEWLPKAHFSFLSPAALTTIGRSMATKQQNLCLSSIRAFLRACFSVSSSRMYLSLTSCMALSSCGWISPRPWRGRKKKNRGKRGIYVNRGI